MSIKNSRIESLVRKLWNGEISATEEHELNTWYNQNQDNPIEIPEEFETSEEQLKYRIFDAIKENLKVNPVVKLWPRIAAVASILLIASAGFLVYQSSKQAKNTERVVHAKNVAPGKQGATLTLANGKKIHLSSIVNGERVSEAGVLITKSKDGQLTYESSDNVAGPNKTNTLSTANGETYRLRLPDGSEVWLNAASSLTYSTSLSDHGKRRVWLEGEGYFQVAKDKAHPFIVESRGQYVEVLGTHFNINAYKDEPSIKTTLLEGSVFVESSANKGGSGVTIRPGQQAIVKGNKINVEKVTAEDAISWKEGYFRFNDEPLEYAMIKVARWYNVSVQYDDEMVKKQTVYGSISRFSDLNKLLDFLELTDAVKFEIHGNKIVVSKSKRLPN